MPPISKDKWAEARLYYEVGATQQDTADKFGVSKGAVQKHIKNEGWQQDIESAIRRRVSEKVAGMDTMATPSEKAAAIDIEAERRVAVNKRHEQMWGQATALQQQAIGKVDGKTFAPDPALQRAAKINAETVRIIIEGERKTYRLEENEITNAPTEVVFVKG
jgi:uncharacterized protein YjcR